MLANDPMRLVHFFVGALGLAACRPSSSTPAPTDAVARSATNPTLTSAEVDRRSLDALREEALRRLGGNWVVLDSDYPGSRQAWSVLDGTVRVYDVARGDEWTAGLTVRSPCELVRTRADRGTTIETTDTFVFADDGLHVAPSATPLGLRRGTRLTVCARSQVYTYDTETGRCDVWDPSMTAYSDDTQLECRITHDLGFDSFVLVPLGGGDSTRLAIQHEALLPDEPTARVAHPAPSWAAAIHDAEAAR
jgi:hypothetical protein